jgi:serine/threonine protein kinase
MPYTEYIATRWYRSPECLMFDGVYTYKMDIWGIGCVFFELITKIPLFPGDDEVDQLHKIHNVLGTPTERALKVMVTAGQQAIEESENKQISSSSSEPGSSKSNRNIFKRPFQFPSAKGCGIRAAFPPHILYGAQRVPPKTASTLPGYNPNDYPGITDECVNLIELLLQYDPEGRPTARQTLKHPWMKECRDLELHEKQQQQLQQPSSSILEAVTTSSIPANGAPGNATSPTEVSKEAASKEPKARRVKAQERAPAVGGIHEENSNGATATSPTKPPAFPNTQNAATNGNANWPKNTRKPAPQVNSNKMPPPMNIAPSTLPPTMEPNGTGKPTKQPSTLDANNISNPLSRVRVPAPARMGSDINQSLPRGPRQNSIEPTGLTQSTTGPNGLMLPKTLVGPQVVAPNKPGLPQPDIRRAASIRRPAPGQPVTLPRLQPQASTQDQISIDEPTSLVSSKLVSLGSQSQINAENGSRTQLQLQGEAISRSQTQMNATAVDEASANSETSAMEVVANNLASTLQVSETLSTETPTSAQVIAMSLEQAEVALAEESQGGTSVQTETNHTVSDTSNESNYKVTSGDAAPTVDVAIPEPAVENLATVSEETAQTVPALT